MASGVVSGVAALVVEKNPGLTPDQVKGALMATLDDVPGAGGVIDANDALGANGTWSTSLARNTIDRPEHRAIDWARASFRRASFRDAAGSNLARTGAGRASAATAASRERRGRSPAGELPKGELPQDDGLRPLARWRAPARARSRGQDLAPHGVVGGLRGRLPDAGAAARHRAQRAGRAVVAGGRRLRGRGALGGAPALPASTHSLSLGELPLVAGLLFLPAHELVVAGLVGSSVALAFDREIPIFKAFFNLAQFTLGTCVALFVVEGLQTCATRSTRSSGCPSSPPSPPRRSSPTSASGRP